MGKILIIEPAFSCVELLSAAKKMGHHVTVVSANVGDRCLPDDVQKEFVDSLIVADSNDPEAIKGALPEHQVYNAVVPGSEYHIVVAALLAEEFMLAGLSIDTAHIIRDKLLLRSRLADKKISSVSYLAINEEADLERAAIEVGFPCIIKPAGLAGSLGVLYAEDKDALLAAYKQIQAAAYGEMGHSVGTVGLLVEKYIQGDEFSVEGVVDKGGLVHVLSISKTSLGPKPYFVEAGHQVPAVMPADQAARIEGYARDVLSAIDFTVGFFHLELRLTADGPIALEVAGRLPGDFISRLYQKSFGLDLPCLMLQSYLEEVLVFAPVPKCYSAVHFFMAPKDGFFSTINFPEDLRLDSRCVEFKQVVEDDSDVLDVETFKGRVGYVICSADTPELLESYLQQAVARVEIVPRSAFGLSV